MPAPVQDVRIVLLGKTGCGKSATGNTILGREAFVEDFSSASVTTQCEKHVGNVDNRNVLVVDTPGLFDTSLSNEKLKDEIVKCVYESVPGPHAFLLVLRLGVRFTEEERNAVRWIQENFSREAMNYSMVLFAGGDQLNKPIEDYLKNSTKELRELVNECKGRYHVFRNREIKDRVQVTELLQKIDVMVQRNGGGHYTNKMYQEAQRKIREEEERKRQEEERKKREEEQKRMEAHRKWQEQQRKKWEEEERVRQEAQRKRYEEEENRRREEDRKRREQEQNQWQKQVRLMQAEQERQRAREEQMRKEERERWEKEQRQRREAQERMEREERQRREENERREKEERQRWEKEKREWEEMRREEQERREREERRRREEEDDKRRREQIVLVRPPNPAVDALKGVGAGVMGVLGFVKKGVKAVVVDVPVGLVKGAVDVVEELAEGANSPGKAFLAGAAMLPGAVVGGVVGGVKEVINVPEKAVEGFVEGVGHAEKRME